MKRNKIFYWILTGLICLWMTFQGVMFIIGPAGFHEMFSKLGFPGWLVLPLGIAKLLAVVAILSKKSKLLKDLAYAGLAIDFIVAFGSHLIAGDGQWPASLIASIILAGSFYFDRKVFA